MDEDIEYNKYPPLWSRILVLLIILTITVLNIYSYFNPPPPNKYEIMVGECIQLNCDTLQITNWSSTYDYFVFDNGIEVRGYNIFNEKGLSLIK